MFKKILPFLVYATIFGCKNDTPPIEQNQAPAAAVNAIPDTINLSNPPSAPTTTTLTPQNPTVTSGNAAFEALKAQALNENDIYGRVKGSLTTLQEEFDKSQGKVNGVGKVTVSVDPNFVLSLKNEVNGDALETRISLKSLDYKSGLELIPEHQQGSFPGLRLKKSPGKSGVEIFKNGKLEKKQDFLEIYMPDRASVERLTPAVVQALMVANGKI